MSDEFPDTTEPLLNGAELPTHPADTTAKKITHFGRVFDDATGTVLTAGLHNNEIAMLMANQCESLSHLFRFVIRNMHIYHTRPLVVIECRTEEIEP